MEKEELKKLFKKYHEGKCTEEEKALLEAWYLEYNEHDPDLLPRRIKAIGNRIFRELPGNHPEFVKIGLRLAIAAATIGIMFSVCLKLLAPNPHVSKVAVKQDILPGSNNATLTLANGNKIDLKKASAGQLAIQSGTPIFKSAAGQLIYKSGGKDPENNQVNNVTTPKGGQWQLVLPDGTKVWLNSATSLSYPANFKNQKDRIVQLNGEAYFEVAKDKLHPFIVKTAQQEVRVLGTHFNVNSYRDEPGIKTTLAEGRIKVTNSKGEIKYLMPGQQSILSHDVLTVDEANVEEAVAWKNGYFRFNDENIQSIMRKLSRWYNIDVLYDTGVSTDGMNGKVSRYKNISQVLKALEATKTVHFKIEGRRVTVMK